jgi:MFS transporter, AAHS family, 4-hydroxybenzoate transporter
MMSLDAHAVVQLPEFIDDRPVGRYQALVITLCGLVMFMDGFDTQSISYQAPRIAREWGLSPTQLAPIFSAALVGLMIGYLVLSPLSDRFGHKRVLVASTAAFAVFTLLSVWCASVGELLALRLLTGLGLGAAAPSAVALTGEFSPRRLRATFVLVIYCGFSLGFAAAGVVAGWLLPAHGWRSMFWVGAIVPLLLAPALVWLLPESPSFLISRGRPKAQVLAVLRRIDARVGAEDEPTLAPADTPNRAGRAATLGALFGRQQILGTLLLWLVFVINLGEFYALQSWLPSMLTSLHYPLGTVVTATTLTTVGGIVAGLLTGPCMDRLGAYGTVATVYLLGCVFVALAGLALVGAGQGAPLWVMLAANFLAGCCVSGGQKSVIALAAVFYPTAVRSSGVGWALGIGRVGGILGPLVVGAALAAHWTPRAVFCALAVPMLVAGVAVLVMGRRYRSRAR